MVFQGQPFLIEHLFPHLDHLLLQVCEHRR